MILPVVACTLTRDTGGSLVLNLVNANDSSPGKTPGVSPPSHYLVRRGDGGTGVGTLHCANDQFSFLRIDDSSAQGGRHGVVGCAVTLVKVPLARSTDTRYGLRPCSVRGSVPKALHSIDGR